MKRSKLNIIEYKGVRNTSGAVALNSSHFIVGDDEENQLRIYDRHKHDKPQQIIALSKLFKGLIKDEKNHEVDLESAANLNGTLFWIGSHSTDKAGEFSPYRHRLLAIKPQWHAGKEHFSFSRVGDIYENLLNDLLKDTRFDKYCLGLAKGIKAKSVGGLSIEGLAATPEHSLLIGFRNPLQGGEISHGRLLHGRALVMELLNPLDVIQGQAGLFADPIELDLNGLGIREITFRKKQKYLIVAGPYHENIASDEHKKEPTRLYKWSRKTNKLKCLNAFDLTDLNVEAAIFYPNEMDTVQLLSDDGKVDAGEGFRSTTLVL